MLINVNVGAMILIGTEERGRKYRDLSVDFI